MLSSSTSRWVFRPCAGCFGLALACFVHVGRRMPAGSSKLGVETVTWPAPTQPCWSSSVSVRRQASQGAPVMICWQGGMVGVLGVTSCSFCNAPGVIWPLLGSLNIYQWDRNRILACMGIEGPVALILSDAMGV
jgi:hypothetical protein